jgi:hypothetical protein
MPEHQATAATMRVRVEEARIPLGHISLSLEMIADICKQDELELYLTVIDRSSVRVNDILDEFMAYLNQDGK